MNNLQSVPAYLKDYAAQWQQDPRQANLSWFADAKYGLFISYGVESLLHKKGWSQFYDNLTVAEVEQIAEHFTAHNFDADAIADLAVRSGMKYVNFTTCHHEGFCLWDSKIEPFNSVNSPCGRDLVRELSDACERRGLGFFVYYTFMLNWRHPYFVDNSVFDVARPHYAEPEPRYLYKSKEDFAIYIDFVERIIDELLTNYTTAGIWLDLIATWYALGEEYIPIERIYDNIRKKHPAALISWKQGATGTEDFASPEHRFGDLAESTRPRFGDAGAERAARGFAGNRSKHNEICATVQKGAWFYDPRFGYKSVDDLYEMLGNAMQNNCNLLLNAGVFADGSVDPIQSELLRQLAEKIEAEGWPYKGREVGFTEAAGAE